MRPAAFSEGGRRQRGVSLIDVLMVVVLVSLAAAAMMTLSGSVADQSAQSTRTRQALALAQALLAEVQHMPFTYCDARQPGDANAATATAARLGAGGCATTVDTMGPEGAETRYNPSNRFDSVNDYSGFQMPGPGCAGICDLSGTVVNGPGSSLAGCRADVLLAAQALAAAPPALSIAALDADGQAQVLRISVGVDCPGLPRALAEGFRVRHAPNGF